MSGSLYVCLSVCVQNCAGVFWTCISQMLTCVVKSFDFRNLSSALQFTFSADSKQKVVTLHCSILYCVPQLYSICVHCWHVHTDTNTNKNFTGHRLQWNLSRAPYEYKHTSTNYEVMYKIWLHTCIEWITKYQAWNVRTT